MKIEFSASGIVLAPGELLNIEHAAGARIGSRNGSVWITQDGDPRDIVLEPGDVFELDRDSPVIVQAIENAVVTIADPVPVRRRHAGEGWAKALIASVRHFAHRPAWA